MDNPGSFLSQDELDALNAAVHAYFAQNRTRRAQDARSLALATGVLIVELRVLAPPLNSDLGPTSLANFTDAPSINASQSALENMRLRLAYINIIPQALTATVDNWLVPYAGVTQNLSDLDAAVTATTPAPPNDTSAEADPWIGLSYSPAATPLMSTSYTPSGTASPVPISVTGSSTNLLWLLFLLALLPLCFGFYWVAAGVRRKRDKEEKEKEPASKPSPAHVQLDVDPPLDDAAQVKGLGGDV